MFRFWNNQERLGGHPLSTYAKLSEKLTFLTPWCAYQGVRNVSFSENFASRRLWLVQMILKLN